MNNRLLLVVAALLIVAGIAGVILLTPGESAETATVPFAIPEPAPEPISGTNDLSDDDPSEGMIGSGEALPGSVPVQPIPKEPLKEPEVPAVVLPRLDDSDPLFRDSVVTLSRIEAVNGWLGGNNLIRKTVLVVDNLARGTLIREPLAILTPTEPFSAIELAEDEFELNPASYRRFDRVTEIFDSLDSRRTAELYVLLHPLFEEAWRNWATGKDDFRRCCSRRSGDCWRHLKSKARSRLFDPRSCTSLRMIVWSPLVAHRNNCCGWARTTPGPSKGS